MKRIECGLSLWDPFELSVLTQQFCDKYSDFTEIVNEMTIEIDEAQKDSYVVNKLWNWLGHDYLNFEWVHLNFIWPNDKSQKSDLLHVKLTLTRL